MTAEAHFVLHPQLLQQTVAVADATLCRLLWMNDARYPWAILVPRRTDCQEVIDLPDAEQAQLWRESAQLQRALRAAFGGDRLNVAAIGNLVPQLHVHHVVRFQHDAAWPAPVWGRLPALCYEPFERERRVEALRSALPPGWSAA